MLEDYFGDDPAMLTKLLSLFTDTTADLLRKLGDAVAQQQAKAVDALSHELKGSCGNLGIDRMSHHNHCLREAAQAQDWSAAQARYQQLMLAFEEVGQAINARP